MTGSLRDPNPHPKQSEDVVPSRKIVVVGLAAIVIFTLGTLCAVAIQSWAPRVEAPYRTPPVPPEVGQQEIGITYQTPFYTTPDGYALRARQLEHLQRYGWVDRERRVISIPVERAMERFLQGARP